MIRAVDHYSFPAGDPDELIAFYSALGFNVLDSYNGRLIAFQFGRQKLNVHRPLLWRNNAFTARGVTAAPGCGDVCFSWSGPFDALREALAALGRPAEAGTDGSIVTRDPDGNLLQFAPAAGRPETGDQTVNAAAQATLATFVVPVADAKAMERFYERLGFAISRDEGWRGTGAVVAESGDARIELVQLFKDGAYAPPARVGHAARPGCSDYCLVWDGTPDSAVACIKAAGGEVESGPLPMQGGDGGGRRPGVSVYTRDPDANLVELIAY